MMMQLNVLQTLADPTRFRIVEALARGEQAVGDLVRAVDIDQSGVSRHLRILGEAGFVTMRPVGARPLFTRIPARVRGSDEGVGISGSLGARRLARFDVALARRRSPGDSEGQK